MKKLLVNTTFSGTQNGVSLGKPISFALILEVAEDFNGDLKPLVHKKLVEMNQEIYEPEYPYYRLNFTAQSF